MTAVSQLPDYAQSSTGLPAGPPLTLADKHLLLLWQVTARTAELLATTACGRWPGAELVSLADYARAEVLRQASDEETLLFAACPSPTATQLARDDLRLRVGAKLLTRAAAPGSSLTRPASSLPPPATSSTSLSIT